MSFMDEFNTGKPISVETKTGFTDTLMEVKKVEMIGTEREPMLRFTLALLEGEHKGKEFSREQRLFLTEEGSLESPTRKGYTNREGRQKAATLAYDILNAAREMGDDRFGQEFSVAQFVGLKFKMGYKKVRDWDFLNTSYQQLQDAEYAASVAAQKLPSEIEAVKQNDSDLPF